MSLQELVNNILEDGRIDAEEVIKLKEAIYADGKVDKEEADVLFQCNDAVSESGNFDPTFTDLFVQGISDFVLNDDETPGEIDETEAVYLYDQISGDGFMDDNEQALLKHLKVTATSIHSKLDELYAKMAEAE